jgi:TrkA-N domain
MTSEPRHSHSSGRVVLVGDDGLGVRVLEELHGLGVAVTAVCARADSPFARAARSASAPLVVGDPEYEDTLREAGVEGASACGLLANADLANLHVALDCRSWRRMPGSSYVSSTPPSSAPCAVWWGDLTVLSSTELAVPAFVAAIFGRRAAAVLPIGNEVLQIVDLTAERPTDVRTLEGACQARVLTVNGTAFPEPHVPVAPDDEVQVVGTSQGLAELERHVAPPAAGDDANERDETAR